MPMPHNPVPVTKQIASLKETLVELPLFRPGSLVERYRTCGKPNCHCAQPGAKGHGPLWSLTRTVNGKTVTTTIPAQAVDTVRLQLAAFKKFQQILRNFIEINVKACDSQIRDNSGGYEQEKKGFPRKSARRLPPK